MVEQNENVRSIKRVPGLSPDARRVLLARAKAGEDVYAYHAAAGWNVWIVNRRVRPEEVDLSESRVM